MKKLLKKNEEPNKIERTTIINEDEDENKNNDNKENPKLEGSETKENKTLIEKIIDLQKIIKKDMSMRKLCNSIQFI